MEEGEEHQHQHQQHQHQQPTSLTVQSQGCTEDKKNDGKEDDEIKKPTTAGTLESEEPTKKKPKKDKKNKKKSTTTNSDGGDSCEPKKRCAFWIPGKRRTCNMPPKEGSLYCPTHEPNPDKVPCPLDPRHLVHKADLERHLAKCPGTGLTHASALPFYVKGINAPGEAEPAPEKGESNVLWRSPERVARVVAQLTEVAKTEVDALPPPLSVKRHENAEKKDREFSRSANGSSKHLPQISSIIKNMEDEGMLAGDRGTVFVEFGAGKAHLARLVAASVEGGPTTPAERLPFLLVDMARFSNKAESTTWRAHGTSPVFSRIQIDITDLDLAKVPEVMDPEARTVVGFGKHLCGAGCDTTIRCMANAKYRLPGLKFQIAIALCCLHKYQKYLEGLGFDKEDFYVLRGLTGWATSDYSAKKEDDEIKEGANLEEIKATSHFTPQQRKDIGLMARRLLTRGRLLYLEEHGFVPRLVRFVPEEVSPENVLLLATSK